MAKPVVAAGVAVAVAVALKAFVAHNAIKAGPFWPAFFIRKL